VTLAAEPGTRVDEIYREVRAELLSAHYEPGQWVKVAELQRRYGSSLSVIREALSRLVAEGLLVAIAQRGFRVVRLSVEDLRDLTEARIKIETLVLREALAKGDNAWEAALIGAHHLLERTPMMSTLPSGERTLSPDYVRAHADFHETLLAGCPNSHLLQIANSLRDSAELYRMWSPKTRTSGREIAEEHRRLTELALGREVEECVELLTRHIDHTRQALDETPAS